MLYVFALVNVVVGFEDGARAGCYYVLFHDSLRVQNPRASPISAVHASTVVSVYTRWFAT